MNKNFFENLALAVSAAVLCGCMVGPDFEKPQPKLGETWNQEISGKLLTDGEESKKVSPEEIARWWEIFEDEQLTSLIKRAFENNLDLAAATATIAQARANLGIVQSGFFPTLDLSAGMTERGITMHDTATSYGMGATAGWEIDLFGGTRRSIESAVANYRATLADKCATRILVAAEVANNYFSYRALQQEIIITKSNLETQKKTYRITLERKAKGFVSQLDVVRAAAEVDSTSSQIPTLQKDLIQTRHALELLLGLQSGALEKELEEPKDLPELERFIPVGVPANLLERRPDIISAEYNLHKAVAAVGNAEADFYPKFFINGSISYEAPKIGNIVKSQYGTWSVGPSATWNIFQAGKTVFNVELQEGVVAQMGANWKSAVLTAIKEVEDSLVAAAKERERIAYINKLVENNKKAFDLSSTLYSEGEIEFLDLLVSQRSMLQSEQSQISSRQLFISHIISLYKSLGGGWTMDDLKDDPQKTDWLFFKDSFGMGDPENADELKVAGKASNKEN